VSNRDRCEACVYWQCLNEHEHDEVGRCRRHAPQTVKDSADITFRNWPCTIHTDWCGEFVDSGRPLDDDWPAGTKDLADKLDELGLTIDVSARKAHEWLLAAGYGRSLQKVQAAQKYRRQAAKFVNVPDDVNTDPFG
jgi:hypothetical protein